MSATDEALRLTLNEIGRGSSYKSMTVEQHVHLTSDILGSSAQASFIKMKLTDLEIV